MFEPTPSGSAPPPARPPFFEAFAPLQLILLGLSLVFLQQFLLGLIGAILPNLFVAILVAVTASLVILPIWLISRHGDSTGDTLRIKTPALTQLGWLALITVGMVLAIDVLGRWNTSIVRVPDDFLEVMAKLSPGSTADWLLSLVGLCLVVPIGEEIVFRGIIQRAARLSLSGPTAALLCGLLFAVLHFEPWYLAPLAVMGIILGMVYELTGSLLAPIFVHGLYNAVVIVNQAVTRSEALPSPEPGHTEILLALAGLGIATFALSKLRPCLRWDEPFDSADPL